MDCYVYLIGVAADGCYKIGWSADPERPLYHLRLAKKDHGLRLLHAIGTADGMWLKTYMHVTFAHCRRRGEWFALRPEEVALFKTVSAAYSPSEVPPAVRWQFNRNGDDRILALVKASHYKAVTEREADELVAELPRLIKTADAGGAPLADGLRWWLSERLMPDPAYFLSLVGGKARQEAFAAEERVRMLSHPGGAFMLPGAVETARLAKEQYARFVEAAAALRVIPRPPCLLT